MRQFLDLGVAYRCHKFTMTPRTFFTSKNSFLKLIAVVRSQNVQ